MRQDVHNRSGVFHGALSDMLPTLRDLYYNAAGVAPHATTNRGTYTVGAGKYALVRSVGVHLIRDTVAGAAGRVVAYANITRSGGTPVGVISQAETTTLTLGAGDNFFTGTPIMLYAGDKIDLFTYDGATGGTMSYMIYSIIEEYTI